MGGEFSLPGELVDLQPSIASPDVPPADIDDPSRLEPTQHFRDRALIRRERGADPPLSGLRRTDIVRSGTALAVQVKHQTPRYGDLLGGRPRMASRIRWRSIPPRAGQTGGRQSGPRPGPRRWWVPPPSGRAAHRGRGRSLEIGRRFSEAAEGPEQSGQADRRDDGPHGEPCPELLEPPHRVPPPGATLGKDAPLIGGSLAGITRQGERREAAGESCCEAALRPQRESGPAAGTTPPQAP